MLFTSGYTEEAILHHGRLDLVVMLLPKPYRKSDLARLVRVALAQVLMFYLERSGNVMSPLRSRSKALYR